MEIDTVTVAYKNNTSQSVVQQHSSTKMDIDNVAIKLKSSKDNVENLIKQESSIKASLSPSMKQLANEIDAISNPNVAGNTNLIEQMNVDDITMGLEDVNIAQSALMDCTLVDLKFDRPVMLIQKYNRIPPVPPTENSLKGILSVTIMHIDIVDLKNLIYSVVLDSQKEEIATFKKYFNYDYNDDELRPPLEYLPQEFMKNAKKVLMIKIDNQWTRCHVKSFNNVDKIAVEDLDTGKIHLIDKNHKIKRASEAELMKSAISFKVKLDNNQDPYAFDVGDTFKIEIIRFNINGISNAKIMKSMEEPKPNNEVELKMKPNDQESNVKKESTLKDPPKKFKIQDLLVKTFKTGKRELTFIDGSKLAQGKMHVCENSEENEKFYVDLSVEIQDYIKQNPNKNNYKPE